MAENIVNEDSRGKIWADRIISGLVGVVASFYIVGFALEPNVHEAKIVEREGRNVMRLYGPGNDRIMVEDTENDGSYIPIEVYLRGLRLEYDVKVEALEDSLYKSLE